MEPPERTYRVNISRRVSKAVERFPAADFERVTAAILALARDPRPRGSKKMQGREGEWRIRMGDYRVVYRVDDDALEVNVVAAGHRGSVYR